MKKALELARAEIGTVEWAEGSNPEIDKMFAEAGHPGQRDDLAWCAAFVGAMLHRAGYKGTGSLLARSYLKWGEAVPVSNALPGDIAVIARGNSTWQGHVFFIDKIANGKVYALGGNQRDAVNIQTYPIGALIGVRRATSLQKAQTTPRKPADLQTPNASPQALPPLRPVPPKSHGAAIVAAIAALVAVVWAWVIKA